MDFASYPMAEAHILDLQAAPGAPTTDDVIEHIYHLFEHVGPYCYAKHNGLLVNDSGEEFAIQFMSVYNSIYSGTY
jgi:hypothetical protein